MSFVFFHSCNTKILMCPCGASSIFYQHNFCLPFESLQDANTEDREGLLHASVKESSFGISAYSLI